MARQFGLYSPFVPRGTTWDETLILEDENGAPINISGLHVRAQLRIEQPTLLLGVPIQSPLLELTTPGYYDVTPAWPVAEVLSIPTGTDGRILLHALPASYAPFVSPYNDKVKLLWAMVLTNKPSTDVAPVVYGKLTFARATTI